MKHIKRYNENNNGMNTSKDSWLEGQNRGPLSFNIDLFEEVIRTQYEKNNELDQYYEVVEDELNDADLGKGIEHKTAVIKRKVDGKFFQFEYSASDGYGLGEAGLANPKKMVGVEVYPHTITTVVYKTKPQK